MPTTYEVVIADTTCFILLHKIGGLDLLKSLFGSVVTTTVIAAEFGERLPEWVIIKEVKNVFFQSTLDIDQGEASAIALALESSPSLLIVLDDDKARKKARRLQLKVTGTLGLFLRAKREGIIPNVKSMLVKVQKTNFYYSTRVFNEILEMAGE